MGDEKEPGESKPSSWGPISEHHWSRARRGMNEEALEHYRERSKAPGVAEGGALRNHYCMQCHGVIPLEYDSRVAAGAELLHCPHCGAELDARVREMFNWVEIDQVPGSDLRAILPLAVIGLLVALGVAVLAWWAFS
jgi:hypothetical protein